MKFRLISILAVSIIAISAFTSGADSTERYGKQKVVYHVNYPGGDGNKSYKGAMRNVQNHINAVGSKNLDLKVLIHGNGIFLLKSAKETGPLQTAVANLKSQNVKFQVCANTLKGKKISTDQLYEVFDEDIVPSGVAELAHLQALGYTYIKP
jgi:intracellular sulfur oxidation DsrE/DsrF family protein